MLPSPPHCATSLPPSRSAARRRSEQTVVIGDPVEGRRREDRVERLLELELEQVAHVQLGPVAETSSRRFDHRGRLVHTDHATARKALEQRLRHTARSAAGVEHRLIAVKLESLEHLQTERLHGR